MKRLMSTIRQYTDTLGNTRSGMPATERRTYYVDGGVRISNVTHYEHGPFEHTLGLRVLPDGSLEINPFGSGAVVVLAEELAALGLVVAARAGKTQ